MGLSNELDRGLKTRIDPDAIKVMPNKVIIRRKFLSEKVGSIYRPQNAKSARATFEGWIHSIGDHRPADEGYEDLKIGDWVVFSYQVGGDDSAFFEWNDDQFALIPIEAIQLYAEHA